MKNQTSNRSKGLLILFISFMCFFVSKSQNVSKNTWLDSIMRSDKLRWDSCLRKLPGLKYQLYYTRIDREKECLPTFTDYQLNNCDSATFYSQAAGLPLALMALEKFNRIKKDAVKLNATMIIEADYGNQMPAYNESHWPDGRPTLERYISNVLTIRDSFSFSRLFEFCGQAFLLENMNRRGYAIQYAHRYSGEDENEARHTNPINFYDNSKIILSLPSQYNDKPYPLFPGFSQPLHANMLHLESLQRLLKNFLFPGTDATSVVFDVTTDQRDFVIKCLAGQPGEMDYPMYDSQSHPNAFFEWLLNDKDEITVFSNGMGYANQVLETAYVTDSENHVEFLFTMAVEYAKSSDIKDVRTLFDLSAESIYNHERKRFKPWLPDFNRFFPAWRK